MNTPVYAVLLACSLAVMAGCDQIESSSKQMLDTAANSARQAIDDTHQAATKALDEARQELSVLEAPQSSDQKESKSDKEI